MLRIGVAIGVLAAMTGAANAQTTTCDVVGAYAYCPPAPPQEPSPEQVFQQMQADEAQRQARTRAEDEDTAARHRRFNESAIAGFIGMNDCADAKMTAQNSGDLDLMAKVAAICH